MKVASTKDRFKVTIDSEGVSFILAPLSAKQKGEVLSSLTMQGGKQVQDRWEMVKTALRYGVKGWDGFEDEDGKPLALPVDDAGNLTDEGLDLIFNLGDGKDTLTMAVLQVMNNPRKMDAIYDGEDKPLEGVTVKREGKA